MQDIVTIIVLTAWISLIINTFLKKFNIESIIWYIATWILVSLTFNLHEADTHTLNTIAEFWIAFLMFNIGLEFSIAKLKTLKKEVFLYWWLQVIITSSIFFTLLKLLLNLETKIAIIVSLALSLSSTAIVLELLYKFNKINKRYWNNALWVLLFQDIAVIPIFIMIAMFSDTYSDVWMLISKVMLSATAVLLIFFVGLKYIIPFILDYITKSKSDELFITSILFIVIWTSQLAHVFWFTYSLWAFVAWMIIAETKYRYQIKADLIPFRDLLLGVFFITVWMQIDIFFIPWNILNILLVLIWIILIKALATFIIMYIGFKKQTSLKTAIILSQVWEFSFAIFELAKINNLSIDGNLHQTIIVAIVFSMLITPLIFKYIDKICSIFISEPIEDIRIHKDLTLKKHIIICWYWILWRKISTELKKINQKYIIIDNDRNTVEIWLKEGENIILWNCAKKIILENLNIVKSKAVIITVWKEEILIMTANTINDISPKIKIITKISNHFQKEQMEKIWVNYIIDDAVEISGLITSIVKEKLS